MSELPFEADQRALAREHYDAGRVRAALHVWDALDHPEWLSDEDVALFEQARREVSGS